MFPGQRGQAVVTVILHANKGVQKRLWESKEDSRGHAQEKRGAGTPVSLAFLVSLEVICHSDEKESWALLRHAGQMIDRFRMRYNNLRLPGLVWGKEVLTVVESAEFLPCDQNKRLWDRVQRATPSQNCYCLECKFKYGIMVEVLRFVHQMSGGAEAFIENQGRCLVIINRKF